MLGLCFIKLKLAFDYYLIFKKIMNAQNIEEINCETYSKRMLKSYQDRDLNDFLIYKESLLECLTNIKDLRPELYKKYESYIGLEFDKPL